MNHIKKYIVLYLAVIGFVDASYLTYKHFFDPVIICSIGAFSDCGAVLKSSYSMMFGLPVALWGAFHYLATIYWFLGSMKLESNLFKRLLFIQTVVGVIFSVYYTYLQFFIIKALCPYCLASAVISLILYFAARWRFKEDYQSFVLDKIWFIYQIIVKPLFFIIPADFVHAQAMNFGDFFGRISIIKVIINKFFYFQNKSLNLQIHGIKFKNPIGLSAGYDYDASFTQVLSAFGFGFQTVGTISSRPCEGNAKPRLGRLPKSMSLLVNKGFRNKGAGYIISKLVKQHFEIPVGISIGRTNDEGSTSLKNATDDIVLSFKMFEKSKIRHSYYELNISCPNLKKGVSFYEIKNLNYLLKSLSNVSLKKPAFVKMPIELDDSHILKILETISNYKFITGVIFGNLQKNRLDPSFDKEEVENVGKGNFSGKPTFIRSNELIKLTYKKYSKRFVIIGCGGVFTAYDAYCKIKNGASLIQMITGLVYEGPQAVSRINRDLVDLLKKDGYKNINEAVGVNCN